MIPASHTCRRAAFVLLAAFGAAGCSGGKDEPGVPATSGGFVIVHVDSTGGTGDAEFYVSEVADPFADMAMNDCVDHTTFAFETPVSEDAGDVITAVSGPTTITMSRVIDGAEIYYSAALAVPGAPANATYKISVGTETLGDVHVPEFPDPVQVNAGTVTWNPMGADEVLLAVYGGTDLWYCRTGDDGSFALPGDLLAAMPASYVILHGFGISHAERAGKGITLTGAVRSPIVSF